MISTRSGALVIDTVVCLTLAKWETVSGRFGGYLKDAFCEIAKSRLNYESNSYRIKETRLWVESWELLWLPVIDHGDTVQGARSKRD